MHTVTANSNSLIDGLDKLHDHEQLHCIQATQKSWVFHYRRDAFHSTFTAVYTMCCDVTMKIHTTKVFHGKHELHRTQ